MEKLSRVSGEGGWNESRGRGGSRAGTQTETKPELKQFFSLLAARTERIYPFM